MEPLHLLCLPDELIIEILSWLPVKSLLQFRVVSKTWKSFISDPQFIKMHLLHRLSFRNADFEHTSLLIKCHTDDLGRPYISSRTVSLLLESPSAIVASRSCISGYDFIGTCNGLVSLRKLNYDESNTENFSQVRFWNPATRTMSQDSPPSWSPRNLHLGFGYDCSSDTYKVVGMIPGLTIVNVYNMGDNCWRTIQISPHAPIHLQGSAVYVSNTLNWLVATNPYFIVSFDLEKEECAQQLSLPYFPWRRKEFDHFVPILGVLRGCLCISQNNKETHSFVVSQMKEYGVNESWTQLFNIIVHERILHSPCFAMCMSENGDVLLFAESGVSQAVLYNQRDNKLEDTKIANNIVGSYVRNYIESLISPS